MKRNGFVFFCAAAVLCFFCGCMNFDYVGQHFPARPESAPVTVFGSRQAMPAGKFRIIGRGVLKGPADIDKYDRISKLKEEARKCGADAFCTVSEKIVTVGLYPRSGGEFASPMSADSNKINLSGSGTPWSNDSFDEQSVDMRGEKQSRKEFEIKVLFLKKTSDFDAEMKKRR